MNLSDGTFLGDLEIPRSDNHHHRATHKGQKVGFDSLHLSHIIAKLHNIL